MTRCILALFLVIAVVAPAKGQNEDGGKAPFPFPEAAPKKDWAWDLDERFDELMEQLAINEASLDAVDAAIAKKTRKKGGQVGAAKRFDENNRLMDRKGGGPMNWREFYGTNAEKFFYHPVDPNTTYHTTTALQQIGKAQDDKTSSDLPTRQGLPVHQRPPQWDYIYRANRTASESALTDALLLATEVQQLEQRRARLEQEQAVLWCKLAFRAVQRIDMHRKQILRFQLVAAGDGIEENEQARGLAAAAQFLSSALLIVEKAEKEQSVAMGSANTVVVEARERFEDALLEQPTLGAMSENKTKPLGQFVALAKLLGDKSKTLSEAYAGAMDGAANNEAARKESYRGMLQRTVIDYAQVLLALNELADAMQRDWGVRVDTKNRVVESQVKWSVPGRRSESGPTSSGTSGTPGRGAQLGNRFYKLEEKVLSWHEAKEFCELRGGRLAVIDTADKMAFVQQLARSSGITFDAMDGIWIGATDEGNEGIWKWVDGSSITYAKWGKGQPNNKGSAEHYAMIWTNDWSWSDQPDKSEQHRTFFICEWDK